MVSKERLPEWRGVGPSVRVPMILCTPCTGLHRCSSEVKVVKDKVCVCVPAKAASFVLTTELQRQNFEISLEISVKTENMRRGDFQMMKKTCFVFHVLFKYDSRHFLFRLKN